MDRTPGIAETVERLKNVFIEMPGMQLSAADAARLSGLEVSSCHIILEALEQTRCLVRRPSGLFIRRSSDSSIR